MALLNCEECNAEISDKAKACPKCGNPNSREVKRQNEEKANKKAWVFVGGTALALAFMAFVSSTIYHSKPRHGPVTVSDSLAHLSGWNETMRNYSASDSRKVRCASIKSNHKALVNFSSRSQSDIKMWEKIWRDNKCKNN